MTPRTYFPTDLPIRWFSPGPEVVVHTSVRPAGNTTSLMSRRLRILIQIQRYQSLSLVPTHPEFRTVK